MLMDSNDTNWEDIESAINRLTEEITKLSHESNRDLESAVFVGMSPDQERRRAQRLNEMQTLLERLQSQLDVLERFKRRRAG